MTKTNTDPDKTTQARAHTHTHTAIPDAGGGGAIAHEIFPRRTMKCVRALRCGVTWCFRTQPNQDKDGGRMESTWQILK